MLSERLEAATAVVDQLVIAGLLNRNTVGKIIFCSRSRQWDLLDPDRR